MNQLKSLLNNKWFFPALVLYYGIFYILFGEWYTKTVSTDGVVFLSLIREFSTSNYFNTYFVYRIVPALIMRSIYTLLSIDFSTTNLFIGFQILNLISIIVSCIFLKKLFTLFKISEQKQLFGFFLFLINFAILKYPFYLAVMTDSLAMMLSTMLLYYYLKNNIFATILITLVLAFTWRMGFYQGLLLIAFPVNFQNISPPSTQQKRIITGGAILYALGSIILYIFIQKQEVDVPQVARIDRNLLPLSIIGIIVAFAFFSKIFHNKNILSVNTFFQKLDYKRVFFSIATYVLVYTIVYLLNPSSQPTYTTAKMLINPFVHSLIKPLLFIVADITYFGVVILVLLFFWNSFVKVISQLGWGLVLAISLNVFLFGITPETRHLSNLFPWIILFLMKAIDKYNFSKTFYFAIVILGFATSKIWLVLNNFEAYPPMQLDGNGCMGFPHQKFWMHIGPWMNEQMYFVQGGLILFVVFIFFLFLYKIEKSTTGKWALAAKYK